MVIKNCNGPETARVTVKSFHPEFKEHEPYFMNESAPTNPELYPIYLMCHSYREVA